MVATRPGRSLRRSLRRLLGPARSTLAPLVACGLAWIFAAGDARAFVAPRYGVALSGHGCPHGMVRIEGGAFFATSTKRDMVLLPYCLDETEVTVAAYETCVESRRCNADGLYCGGTQTYGIPGKSLHPVNCVTWTEMRDYCAIIGKRLPTAAEWEWAARGGLRAYDYPWGNDQAGFDDTCHGAPVYETCPVRTYPPNVYGLYDLSGNVWEWTSGDGEQDSSYWFGGSYGTGVPMKNDVHGGDALTWRDPEVGFRCAK